MSTEVWICLLAATIIVTATMAFLTKLNNGLMDFSSLTQILSSLLGQGSGEIPRYIQTFYIFFNSCPADAFRLKSSLFLGGPF